jgi:hypothetical protein
MQAAGAPGADRPEVGVSASRFLAATVAGYSVAASFESEQAAQDAQLEFDSLVREVTNLVSNASEAKKTSVAAPRTPRADALLAGKTSPP